MMLPSPSVALQPHWGSAASSAEAWPGISISGMISTPLSRAKATTRRISSWV